MAVFLNEVTLMGNLTTDPEMGEYADGTPVCRFSIAIKKQWKDPNGEKQEKSIFLPIIFTGNMVTAYIEPFIHRGDNVWLRGEVNPYSFTKADGSKLTAQILWVEKLNLFNRRRIKINRNGNTNCGK